MNEITLNRRPPPPDAVPWMIQCDFDGTISVPDVTDSLLNHYGLPGWQEAEAAWTRGEIGSRVCMQRQVALLDVDETELIAHLDTIDIDPAFPAFVMRAETLGITVQVISDGIDYAIRHILKRNGLGHLSVTANQLVAAGQRRWALQSPHADSSCARDSGTCKCASLRHQRAAHRRIAFIGDSTSDFCVSGCADWVYAKNKLIVHCLDHGIAHTAFEHFGQLLGQLDLIAADRKELA